MMWAACLCGLVLLYACRAQNPLLGRWCTDPPSALLYEYRPDGSVHLLTDTGDYHVFRYQTPRPGALRLFDGMGRIQDYTFSVDGDTISLYDARSPSIPADHLRRVRDGEDCGK